MSAKPAKRATFHFQIITTPTVDTRGTAIVLHFDNKRYILGNVPEGTQRAFIQRGVALKKALNVFLTGPTTWERNGGLLGMILTMADVHSSESFDTNMTEKPRLHLHGGPMLMHTIACARRFVFRTNLPLDIQEFEPDMTEKTKAELEQPTWTDENVQIWALPVFATPHPSTTDSDGDNDPTLDPFQRTGSHGRMRKRSRDQFERRNHAASTSESYTADQELRKSIVADMFESGWRNDALIETTWKEVKKPAKMFVRDPESTGLSPFIFEPTESMPEPAPDQKVFVRKPWPGTRLESSLPTSRNAEGQTALSYIVRGHPQRGVFDVKKAVALGVPRGPLYSALADGNTLKLDNGNIITPSMVLGPTKPGSGFAVIDIPRVKFVDAVLARPEWKSSAIMSGIKAICWILGQSIAFDDRVKSFMQSLPAIEHIVSSTDTCPNYLSMDSSAASSVRLSRISRDHFPVPIHENRVIPQISAANSGPGTMSCSGSRRAERGLKIQLEPKFQVMEDEVVPALNTAQIINEMPGHVLRLAWEARRGIAQQSAVSGLSGNATLEGSTTLLTNLEPQIITLGTGSAMPSKYRNVSATLVRVPGVGSYLFDCGENTLGQLSRFFSDHDLTEVFRDLKLIWVSHPHADHHLGLISVCEAWCSRRWQNDEKLIVATDGHILQFLADYGCLSMLPNVVALGYRPSRRQFATQAGRTFHEWHSLGIKEFKTCNVNHCHHAQAVSVTFDDGFKFSYSGDCRPSKEFAKMGLHSDVLVHEATFDDEMEGDARAKKHSTTGEALAVGMEMKAKNVILTHFSQRYQKLPVMDHVKLPEEVHFEEAEVSDENVGAPLDETFEETTVRPSHTYGPSDAVRGATFVTNENAGEAGRSVAEMKLDTIFGTAGWKRNATQEPRADETLSNEEATCATYPGAHRPAERPTKDIPPGMNVCVAFDLMHVRVSDIKNMHKLHPALNALFEEDIRAEALCDADLNKRNEIVNRGKSSPKKAGAGIAPEGDSRKGSSQRRATKNNRQDPSRERQRVEQSSI